MRHPKHSAIHPNTLTLRRFWLYPEGSDGTESVVRFNPRRQPANGGDKKEIDSVPYILEWALPTLLKSLSLDNLLLALGCALTEMQVVFKCADITALSCCVVAVTSLLRPLKWACPVIVTLPSHLHIYLESPVPVVLGVTGLPPGHEPPGGQCIIDIEENKVELNEEEVSTGSAPLPHTFY